MSARGAASPGLGLETSARAAGVRPQRGQAPLDLPGGLLAMATILVLFAQMILFGANSALLATSAAFGEVVLALGAVALAWPRAPSRLWFGLAPLGLLWLGLTLWGSWPLWGGVEANLNPLLARQDLALELVKLSGAAAAFVVGAVLGARRGWTWMFLTGVILATVPYVCASFWGGQIDPHSVWGASKGADTYRFTGTLLNANAAACLFGMLGLIGLGRIGAQWLGLGRGGSAFSRSPGWWWTIGVSGVAAATAFVAVAMTGSRAGLILTLLFALLLGLTIVFARRRMGRLTMAIAAAILVAGAGLVALRGDGALSRFALLWPDLTLRLEGYRTGLALAAHHPLHGSGLGSYAKVHAASLTPETAVGQWDFGAAHSAILQTVIEAGWPFGIVMVLIWIVIARRVLTGPTLSPMRLASLFAVLMALACSFIDIALNVPVVANLTLTLTGIVWASSLANPSSAGAGETQAE